MTLPIFLAVFFVGITAYAHMIINEIKVGDKDYPNNEFIEIYNDSDENILLDGYKIKVKKTSSGEEKYLANKTIFSGKIVKAGSYLVVAYPGYDPGFSDILTYSTKSNPLAKNNTILFYDDADKIVDLVGYGTAPIYEKSAAINPEDGKSIGRIDGDDTDDNSKDFYVLEEPSPGNKNEKKKEEVKEEITYVSGVIINEVYPHPRTKEDQEFIELFNMTDGDIDISKWELHDATKTGKYIFPEKAGIDSREYLVVYRDDFKFALNDSGSESVILLDPKGVEKCKVEYKGSKTGLSYSLDKNKWRWTKFLTPGATNIFNNLPEEKKTSIPKEAYTNMYADFSTKTSDADGEKVKVTWDFGDGHKSYLAKTRHKYEKQGKYKGSLKITDGSEDVVKEFTVEVEDYPERKVRIVAINANPIGKDTEGESITVQNKSKKKISFNGWSVATGANSKKLSNHPIKEDLEIKAGKTGEITRDICALTLNNTKGLVELRYPDGSVAHSVKYKKENKDTIKEGEVYEKKGEKWAWTQTVKSEKLKAKSENSDDKNAEANIDSNLQLEIGKMEEEVDIIENSILPEEIGGQSADLSLKPESIEIVFANMPLEEKVLGAETSRVRNVYEYEGAYRFTSQCAEQQHYAVIFCENMFIAINTMINKVINNI